MWARVAGDAFDLATLADNMRNQQGENYDRAKAAMLAVAGVTFMDVMCSMQLCVAESVTDD